jgi:hypothetical protein
MFPCFLFIDIRSLFFVFVVLSGVLLCTTSVAPCEPERIGWVARWLTPTTFVAAGLLREKVTVADKEFYRNEGRKSFRGSPVFAGSRILTQIPHCSPSAILRRVPPQYSDDEGLLIIEKEAF